MKVEIWWPYIWLIDR